MSTCTILQSTQAPPVETEFLSAATQERVLTSLALSLPPFAPRTPVLDLTTSSSYTDESSRLVACSNPLSSTSYRYPAANLSFSSFAFSSSTSSPAASAVPMASRRARAAQPSTASATWRGACVCACACACRRSVELEIEPAPGSVDGVASSPASANQPGAAVEGIAAA